MVGGLSAVSGIGLALGLHSGLGRIYSCSVKALSFFWSQFLQPGMRNKVPVNVSQTLTSSDAPGELIKV